MARNEHFLVCLSQIPLSLNGDIILVIGVVISLIDLPLESPSLRLLPAPPAPPNMVPLSLKSCLLSLSQELKRLKLEGPSFSGLHLSKLTFIFHFPAERSFSMIQKQQPY